MNNIYVRLAKTNIQNNRQLYLPYIISGIVTVMMFYLMMFINNNPGLKSIPGSVNLKTIMALGVGIITIFAYIFIFYTNSFISKRRKKEIGVYNILGMEKRHIARVLGLETVFVTMLVIAGGILSGIIFSKLILMLLYRMLGFQGVYHFIFPKQELRGQSSFLVYYICLRCSTICCRSVWQIRSNYCTEEMWEKKSQRPKV